MQAVLQPEVFISGNTVAVTIAVNNIVTVILTVSDVATSDG